MRMREWRIRDSIVVVAAMAMTSNNDKYYKKSDI